MDNKVRKRLKVLGSIVVGGTLGGVAAMSETKKREWKRMHPGIAAKGENVISVRIVERVSNLEVPSFTIPKGVVLTVRNYGDINRSTYCFEEIDPIKYCVKYIGETAWYRPEFPVSEFSIVKWEDIYPNIAAKNKKVIAIEDFVDDEIIAIKKGDIYTVDGYGDWARDTYTFKEIPPVSRFDPYCGKWRYDKRFFPVTSFLSVEKG